jgi:copper transport protein
VLLAALVALAVVPLRASAHAFLQSSTPAANAVVAVSPTTVTMVFTEPLERASSRAALYDQTGAELPDATYRAGNDEYTMVLDLPASLPNGTYTVAWETLSTADGHSAQGYIPFTVGTSADVQTFIPPVLSTASGPPLWLSTLSRWVALLGLAVTIAVWPVWLLVLRPGISPAWQAGPALTRRVKRVAAGGIGLALAGSVFALLVQATSFNSGDGYLADLGSTLTETRYGRFWLIRVGLLLVLGAILTLVGWWWPRRTRFLTIAGLVLTSLLPIPFSEVAHAAALTSGRANAIAFDAAHLLGAGIWVGGLAVLVLALVPSLRDLTPAGRRVVLSRVLPRFSTVALVAWGVLGLTGLYSAWLHVGNLDALRETDYGQSLLWKLLLLVPLLGLGAFNLLVVTRRIRSAGRDAARTTTWGKRFGLAITAELALVILLFLIVGRRTGQAPAREELALGNGRATSDLSAEGTDATLIITPASTGPNHYRLEVDGDPLPTDTSAILRIELPSQGAGQLDIPLVRAAGNAFEGHGSELSITGDWTIQTILIRPGQDDWTVTKSLTVGASPPTVDLPAPAWRFGTAGIVGLILLVAGGAGLVIAWFAGRAPIRRESAGLGTVAMVAGVILLLQARIDTAETLAGGPSDNPIEASSESISRGQQNFLANCVSCHGPAGRGDGPQAASLDIPPADLTASHARSHRDEDLYYWIQNGIVESAMPPFADVLDEDEIWDTVNYIRSLQDAVVRDIPQPEDCTVEPITIDALQALADPAATEPAANRVPATPAALPAGTPADADTVAQITGVTRQLIACSNARDPLRRLALFSEESLKPNFTQGPTDTLIRLTGTPPVALPPEIRVSIVSISDVQVLPDGRVRATVAADNPTTHAHGPNGEELAGQQTLEVVTLVFVQEDGRWLIDDQVS